MLPKILNRSGALLISLTILTAPLAAQKTAPQTNPAPLPKAAGKTAPPDQPAATIDTLLAADSYEIYGEVQNVGQLVSSGNIGDLLEPVMKLASPPKEFTALVKFLNANAEPLTDSRLLFATLPARPGIPTAFVVIELASPEDAVKFEPKLNRLLPVILPTPTPTPAPTSSNEKGEAVASSAAKPTEPGGQVIEKTDQKPAPPPFVVSRSGNLIFVTDKPFKFEKLRPAGSRLLTEDQNFRFAHDRFSSESIFIFFNVALEQKSRPKPSPLVISEEEELARTKAEEQEKNAVETIRDPEAPQPPKSRENANAETNATFTVQARTGVLVSPPAAATPTPSQAEQMQTAALSQFGSLVGLLAGGEPEWPDAVGVAISQETNDFVIRAILVGPQNGKRLVLPFVPQLLAGRSYTPSAPSVLPDDTEVFVSASFDLPRTYEGMLAHLELMNKKKIAQLRRVPAAMRHENDDARYDPFGEFETKGKFKIKDDLLAALGSEFAIAGSLKSLDGAGGFGLVPSAPSARPEPRPSPEPGTDQAQTNKQAEEQGSPTLLISVKDREAARRLMPRVLDGLGFGAANLIGMSVKRDDTEMVDFAGAFAYAFVGDFLVISTSATVRHVIDGYINHHTLASNTAFRNFTRWQPREIVGQIYVSPALMESYQKAARDPSQMIAAAMRDYMMRLNPEPQAITYTLSNEGFGAIHQLHLPKTFVLASVAGAASATKEPPPEMNEAIAMSLLRMIANAEASYQSTTGSYGSLDKLVEAKLVQKEMFDKYGYRIEVTASGTQFEATATPVEYGKSGRRSFFVDQSGVVRGDDHGGAPATVADKQAQ